MAKVSANNISTLVDVVKASVEHPLTQDKSEVTKGVKYTTQIRYPSTSTRVCTGVSKGGSTRTV